MLPWKNSWFQIALFAWVVSGALLVVDYAPKIQASGTWMRAFHRAPTQPSEAPAKTAPPTGHPSPAKEPTPARQAHSPSSDQPAPNMPTVPIEDKSASKAPTPARPVPASSPTGTAFKVRYTDIKLGTGAVAVPGWFYTINYTIRLKNGTKVYSSLDPGQYQFQQGAHRVIAGLDDGFAGMKVGGKRSLEIPYQLAYGEQGQGSIPPKSNLIMEIELVAQHDPSAPQSPPRPSGTTSPADIAKFALAEGQRDVDNSRFKDALGPLRKACVANIAMGCRIGGSILENGLGGVAQDRATAAALYMVGCNAGDDVSCSRYKALK